MSVLPVSRYADSIPRGALHQKPPDTCDADISLAKHRAAPRRSVSASAAAPAASAAAVEASPLSGCHPAFLERRAKAVSDATRLPALHMAGGGGGREGKVEG